MNPFNIVLTLAVLVAAAGLIYYFINKNKKAVVEEMEVDDKTFTLLKMRDFVKRRLDEITKVNLYDIGLSEEE